VDHLPPEIKEYAGISHEVPKKGSVDEPKIILEALNETDWNKAKAARLLGISRPTLYQKIEEFKLINPTE
jgi:DNA-binding NtrC family response regulator